MTRILLLLAPLVLSLPLAGRAAEPAPPRPVDMTAVLTDPDGAPLKDASRASRDDADCERCPPLTLGRVAAQALFASFPDERDLSGEAKWARGDLAVRIRDNRAAVLRADDRTLIKRLVGKAFGPLVVARAYPLLDPDDAPGAAKP